MAGRAWTDEERAYLRGTVGRFSYRHISFCLGRSRKACEIKAIAMGLAAKRGSPEWKAKTARMNRGRRLNPAGEFKPGHVPWSKGKKGLAIHPNSRKGWFKPGDIRGNAARKYRFVGKITIRTDKTGAKRRWIKVSDNGRPQDRWIPLARYLYEREHGPIPPGCFIVHGNGDTLDDGPDNLLLMDHKRLTAWQSSVRPDMAAKRRAASSKVTKQRWRVYRANKAKAAEDAAERERLRRNERDRITAEQAAAYEESLCTFREALTETGFLCAATEAK